MELRHLRYFVAVAEELSFTAAARRLRTAQPSLSQQIRQLERFVGTPLLERTKRSVRLTGAGRVFLREARDILARTEHAVELAQLATGAHAGELSLGTNPVAEALIIPKIMPLAVERMPEIRFLIHSMLPPAMLAGLRNFSVDACFMWGPVQEADLTSVPILEQRILVVLPARHPLARAGRISLPMLDDLPCITAARANVPALHHLVNTLYKQAGIRAHPVQEADSVFAHLNMVAAGLGFALLPEYVRSILPHGVVARALAWKPPASLSLLLVHRKDDSLPALGVLRELLDVLRLKITEKKS